MLEPQAEFEVEFYELWCSKVRVRARSRAEAIMKALDGDGDPVDNSSEYIETAEDYGMPTDENRELAEELRQQGFDVECSHISGIRGIERTYENDDDDFIDDDDDTVVDATYVSIFDDDIMVESPCKYNAETKQVFAIQDGNTDVADNADAMTDEYVVLPNRVELREEDGVHFNY